MRPYTRPTDINAYLTELDTYGEPESPTGEYNNEGAPTYIVSPMEQFRRFIILGTTSPTYYQSAKDLTKMNLDGIRDLLEDPNQGMHALNELARIRKDNLAPMHGIEAMLVVLALAYNSSSLLVRREAASMLPSIAQTHSQLLSFIRYVLGVRGHGRLFKKSVSRWYNDCSPEALEYQLLKYKSRYTWTAGDVLALVRPKPPTPEHDQIYGWARGTMAEVNGKLQLPPLLSAVERIHRTFEQGDLPVADATYALRDALDAGLNVTWEMLPTQMLNSREVWELLLPTMRGTALMRNLGRMSSIGMLADTAPAELVSSKLSDLQFVKRNRLHPYDIMIALTTYSAGRGVKGSLTWTPNPIISKALEEGFYKSFATVQPSYKNLMLCTDISASMTWPESAIRGTHLRSREAAAVMALVAMKTEPLCIYSVFTHGASILEQVTERSTLQDVIRLIRNLPFGGTHVEAPIKLATKMKLPIDTFVVYTDNETQRADGLIPQYLDEYQQAVGREARLISVAFAPNRYTVCSAEGNNMLDVIGFDSSAPAVISNFSARRI